MQDVIDQAVRYALSAAVAAILPMLVAALFQYLRKLGLDVSAQQQARLATIVEQAVFEVEEWAARLIKAQLPVTSGQKLERAIATVLDKMPGVTRAEAEALVHATLPNVGTGAAVFLRQLGTAAVNDVR